MVPVEVGIMELSYYTQKRNEMHIMRILNKKYWPHHVAVKDPDQAERWCYSTMPSKNWRNVGKYFAFKQKADATMFALKWS